MEDAPPIYLGVECSDIRYFRHFAFFTTKSSGQRKWRETKVELGRRICDDKVSGLGL